MNNILKNWTFMRGIRLLLGVVILVQSIVTNDIMFGAMSLLLIAMPLFNFGCCSGGACGVGLTNIKTNSKIEDVEFEEVKSK